MGLMKIATKDRDVFCVYTGKRGGTSLGYATDRAVADKFAAFVPAGTVRRVRITSDHLMALRGEETARAAIAALAPADRPFGLPYADRIDSRSDGALGVECPECGIHLFGSATGDEDEMTKSPGRVYGVHYELSHSSKRVPS